MKKISPQVWIVVAAGIAVILGALVLAKANPAEAIRTLGTGSFGSMRALSGTLKETTPLLVAGCAVYLALQAGLFNIGVEGQLVMGACTAAAVGVKMPTPAGFFVGCAAAMIVGGLWALPAGWIKAYRGGHEVITTIMLNNIAIYLTDALVIGPLKDPAAAYPTTESLSKATRLASAVKANDLQINFALLVGVGIAVGMAIWLKKTKPGYELRATGANATAAKFAGVDTKRVTLSAMVVSGAIGGLAGALMVFAHEFRFYQGFSPGYGFDALGVALLAGGSSFGLLPSALFFGALAKGGTALAALSIPKGITTLTLGVVVLAFAAVRYGRKAKGGGDGA